MHEKKFLFTLGGGVRVRQVRYTAYTASDGRAFASTSAARRPYNYQAGVKDEVQDEPTGGVMGMRVGEKR